MANKDVTSRNIVISQLEKQKHYDKKFQKALSYFRSGTPQRKEDDDGRESKEVVDK